jgi:hypothetical protein
LGQDMTPYLKSNLKHGGKGPKPIANQVLQAARDVRFVRAHYKGKNPRPDDDTIFEIVANRHDVTVPQVRSRLKKRL